MVLVVCWLQIEGGFVQGMGWLCLEEMIWGDKVRARAVDVHFHLKVKLELCSCIIAQP
jgi:xanthine dehydrogenase molybdopterin-binding subunit B